MSISSYVVHSTKETGNIYLLYLDDVMHAFEKIRELVVLTSICVGYYFHFINKDVVFWVCTSELCLFLYRFGWCHDIMCTQNTYICFKRFMLLCLGKNMGHI